MRRRTLLVAGNGMVGQRVVERAATTDLFDVVVVGEEPRPAYDRVALSSWFEGRSEADLSLCSDELLGHDRVEYLLGHRVVRLDVDRRTVTLDDERVLGYDELVLATGSSPFVPPIAGHDLEGCFVYRTLDDLAAIRDRAEGRSHGVVIGGGLLGLEAANALRALGLETHVVEMAPYPMPQQLGEGGGRMLARWVDSLGVHLHCDVSSDHFAPGEDGSVAALHLADGTVLPADLVVFSAGIRPRDELARAGGLEIADRGGVLVDDTLATSAPNVWAVGEVAAHRGRCSGLVAPGYAMADALVAGLSGGEGTYEGSDLSTRLKLLGVDVAAFGASTAQGDGIDEIVYHDPVNRIFRRLALDAETGRLLGGTLVGDASGYELLRAVTLGDVDQPADLPAHVLPADVRPPADGALPDGALLCSCNAVSVGSIRDAVADGCATVGELKECTGAGTSCGGCVPALGTLLKAELAARGVAVSDALCEHFDHSRQELFGLIRFHGHHTWAEVLEAHGRGRSCEIAVEDVPVALRGEDRRHRRSTDLTAPTTAVGLEHLRPGVVAVEADEPEQLLAAVVEVFAERVGDRHAPRCPLG
ncbi:MAG: FAD-dependent oxidoreductase, partial [Actinomycetota bacterium]